MKCPALSCPEGIDCAVEGCAAMGFIVRTDGRMTEAEYAEIAEAMKPSIFNGLPGDPLIGNFPPNTWAQKTPAEIFDDIKVGIEAMKRAFGDAGEAAEDLCRVLIPLKRYERMFTNLRGSKGWRRHVRKLKATR